MSKKKKFDLTALVHHGYVKENETIYLVSDPSKYCVVHKFHNGEFKVEFNKEITTIHAFVQTCLGIEPPDHASKWVRVASGKTLYEFWDEDIGGHKAA